MIASTRTASLTLLLALICLSPACGEKRAYQNPPTVVRVTAVQLHEAEEGARYSANIVPYSQVDLSFKVGGYVERILREKGVDGRMRDLQQGDRVSIGRVLAQVRQDDYAVRVDQARMQLAQANGALDSARSQLAAAQTAANQALLDFTRARNLFESQSVTKADLDAAQSRREASQDGVSTAKGQVAAAQAQVGAAQEAVKAAELALADTSLKSPMEGVVIRRLVEVGTLVGPGTPAFVLADTRSVKAVFGVPDVIMGRVRPGDRQKIETVFGASDGRITAISPAADPKSRVFSVEVTIPNPSGQIKAGMVATLRLSGAKPANAIPVIPLSAVIRSLNKPDGYAVFLFEQQAGKAVARMRDVELGEAYGNMIEVRAGLSLAQQVITTGASLVKDGDAVQVVP